MENTTKLKLYYNETHKSKKNNSKTNIYVDYFSHTEIEIERCAIIRAEFKEYMSEFDCDSCDIIDIINKVRELTEDLEEKNLEVKVQKGEYCETARYVDGYRDSSSITSRDWDDIIEVTDTYRGTKVEFKKDRYHLHDTVDSEEIHNILFEYYQKVIKLNNLKKEKAKVYEK